MKIIIIISIIHTKIKTVWCYDNSLLLILLLFIYADGLYVFNCVVNANDNELKHQKQGLHFMSTGMKTLSLDVEQIPSA